MQHRIGCGRADGREGKNSSSTEQEEGRHSHRAPFVPASTSHASFLPPDPAMSSTWSPAHRIPQGCHMSHSPHCLPLCGGSHRWHTDSPSPVHVPVAQTPAGLGGCRSLREPPQLGLAPFILQTGWLGSGDEQAPGCCLLSALSPGPCHPPCSRRPPSLPGAWALLHPAADDLGHSTSLPGCAT